MVRFRMNVNDNIEDNDVEVPDFWRGNIEGLVNEVDTIKWEVIFLNKHTEEMWHCFKSIIERVPSKYIPLRKIRIHKQKTNPWLYRKIKNKKIKNKLADKRQPVADLHSTLSSNHI